MIRGAVVLCAISPVLTVGIAAAEPTGDYLTVRVVGGFSFVDGITENQSGPLTENHTGDQVAGLGVALGYDWSRKGLPLRTEIAYHYRFRFDLDLRIDNGITGDGYENNLSSHALLVNLLYDFDLGSDWRPYVGGGIGWARNNSDVTRTPLITGASEEREDASDNFVWNATLGITYRWTDAWSVELAYRYIDLGTVEMGPYANGTVIEAEDYVSHDLLLGIQYRF